MIITKQLAVSCLNDCQTIAGDFGRYTEERVIKSRSTDAEALVLTDHDLKIITLVFKGSKEGKDWVEDSRFCKVTVGFMLDKPVRVHSGFNECELSIHGECTKKLLRAKEQHPDYKIVGTGHSLGNSMIELFLYRTEIKFDAVLGFGGACTGNEPFSLMLAAKTARDTFINFIFVNDLIPLLLKGRFNYHKAGRLFTLFWVDGVKYNPANKAAYFFNHDTEMNYKIPIEHLPGRLNESVLI